MAKELQSQQQNICFPKIIMVSSCLPNDLYSSASRPFVFFMIMVADGCFPPDLMLPMQLAIFRQLQPFSNSVQSKNDQLIKNLISLDCFVVSLEIGSIGLFSHFGMVKSIEIETTRLYGQHNAE